MVTTYFFIRTFLLPSCSGICSTALWDPIAEQPWVSCWRLLHRPAMGSREKSAPPRKLPSKRHSCSELQNGHRGLMKVKREHMDPEELQKKVEDTLFRLVSVSGYNMLLFPMVGIQSRFDFPMFHGRNMKRQLPHWSNRMLKMGMLRPGVNLTCNRCFLGMCPNYMKPVSHMCHQGEVDEETQPAAGYEQRLASASTPKMLWGKCSTKVCGQWTTCVINILIKSSGVRNLHFCFAPSWVISQTISQ